VASAQRNSKTGLLNIHEREDELWGLFYEVDIRIRSAGHTIRRLKRFKDVAMAIEWRDLQRRSLGLSEAIDRAG
jgi:hypothetical protein